MGNVPFGYEDGYDVKGAPSEPNPGVQFAEPENGWDGNAVVALVLSIICLLASIISISGYFEFFQSLLVGIITLVASAAILSTARRSLHAISRNILGLAILISLISISVGNDIRLYLLGY